MAESRSKRPRTSGLVDGIWPLDSIDYFYGNSSSIPDRIGKNKAFKNKEAIAALTCNHKSSIITEKKDEKENQVGQCATISEEFREQHPPLACTRGPQQPPLLIMPIIGDSASENLALQKSLRSDSMMESVKKEVVTEVSLPSITRSVGAADLGFNNMSVEELEAEKQCTEKIAVISQQLKKIEAYMKEVKEAFKKEMDLERETSLITILTRAEATFAACTCYFERLQSEAAKLQLEISTKSEDVRNLKTAMKEAKTRVRKSEIEYETFDRMELTTLLHVMVREERLAAVWRELAPKIKTFEDLEYQHGAAEEEENKLKEELRAANVRLNQAKNECEETDRELEKVRKEFDRLKENLDLSQIEYESQRKAKSIELLDAKDNLLKLKALEISRRRKELLMERKELAASHPSAPLSINSQFSLPVKSGVVELGSRLRPVTRPKLRLGRTRRYQLQSSDDEAVEYSSQQVESQAPLSSV